MRLTVVCLFFLVSYLRAASSFDEETDSDDDIWKDLVVGRMWQGSPKGAMDKTADSADFYANMFKNFDSDFVETEKKDDQWEEEETKTFNSGGSPIFLRDEIEYEQDQEEDEVEEQGSPGREEEVPVHKLKGSLVIVFDTTHSMAQELNEVKKGAKAIMDALVKQPNSPIHNFIFSPFNDPVVGPLTITTDPKVMEAKMDNITVYGGGDCPEMCLTGLMKALEACLPNSKVYVFTDAPPKDADKYKTVVSLVQRKRAEVNFIITKGCIKKNFTDIWAYDYIAQTSSGHLFKVTVQDLKNVLKFVKIIIQPNEVQLLSANRKPSQGNTQNEIPLVVDSTLSEFTASVSGLKATLGLKNEKGVASKNVEKILDLPHLKVMRVVKPNPGTWKINVTSPYPHMIRVTGTSNITFTHGFSRKETDNLKNTNNRPLKDAASYILIQTTDIKNEFTYKSVDIVDLRDTTLMTLPLVPVDRESSLYRASNFTPPNKFFYLRINGVNKNGTSISRISATAISPQKPEPPFVSMRKVAIRRQNLPGEITCDIESQVPVTVGWKKNGNPVDKTQICSEACQAVLHFKRFRLKSQGNYTCYASNSAGNDQKDLILRVGNPLVMRTKSPVHAVLGGDARLICKIRSDLPVRVNWKRQDNGILNATIAADHSLVFKNLTKEDFGSYWCLARNGISRATAKVDLLRGYI